MEQAANRDGDTGSTDRGKMKRGIEYRIGLSALKRGAYVVSSKYQPWLGEGNRHIFIFREPARPDAFSQVTSERTSKIAH